MGGHRLPKKPARVADWHKADIKAALEKRGWTIRSLARHHGVHHRTLNQALYCPYLKSEQRIADAIGVQAAVIWPSRYLDNATPKRKASNSVMVSRKRRRDGSTGRHNGHGKAPRLN